MTSARITFWVLVGGSFAAVSALAASTDVGAVLGRVGSLVPVLVFLMAALVVSSSCDADGLFLALGARLSRAGARRRTGLLAWSAAAAATVTAVLNLDATVVLLTPVLVAAAHRDRTSAQPVAWVAHRMANSASTLLPVSNLTNLLAVSATGLSFARFTWVMWPVWLVAVVGEWAVTRVAFARELAGTGRPDPAEPPPIPRTSLVVVALMLAGFVLGSTAGVPPYVPALAAAVVLASVALRRGRMTPGGVLRSANIPLACGVACWAVVVEVIAETSIGSAARDMLPLGTSLPDLVMLALISMVVANVVNNLPATLFLVPLVGPYGTLPVLAVLVGVNVGANLTYLGSLANLLWRSTAAGDAPGAFRHHALALATTPAMTAVAAATLWWWGSVVL